MRWEAGLVSLPTERKRAHCTTTPDPDSPGRLRHVFYPSKNEAKNLNRQGATQHRKDRVRPAGNAKENYGTLPTECGWPLLAAAWSTMDFERHRPQTAGFRNRPRRRVRTGVRRQRRRHRRV